MGLETGNRIEDLNPSWPNSSPDEVSQGDDHLRLIKTCLQGSLPSLGGGQCNATAEELGDVVNKLVSFNGRTDTAAVPEADDYDINDIARIIVGTINEGDVLVGNSSNEFEAIPSEDAILPPIEYGRWTGSPSRPSTNQFGVVMASLREDTFTDFATVTNTAADGWEFTADVDNLQVTINFMKVAPGGPDIGFSVNASTAVSISSTAESAVWAHSQQAGNPISATVRLSSGDVLRVHTDGNIADSNNHILTVAAQRASA